MTDIAPEAAPAPEASEAPAPEVQAAPAVAVPDGLDGYVSDFAPQPEPAPEEAGESIEVPAAETTVDDPFSAYGGKESVDRAYKMWEMSRTDDGVVQLFLEAGQSLGLGLDKMQAIFEGEAGLIDDAPEAPDPDEPLTRAEFAAALEAQQRAAQEATAAQLHEANAAAVKAEMSTLGLDPADPATQIILNLGDRHYDRSSTNPQDAVIALRKGHADYAALVQRESAKYLETKVSTAATVPGAPSGSGAPPTETVPEPHNTLEAIQAVRRRMRDGIV